MTGHLPAGNAEHVRLFLLYKYRYYKKYLLIANFTFLAFFYLHALQS